MLNNLAFFGENNGLCVMTRAAGVVIKEKANYSAGEEKRETMCLMLW